MALSWRTNRNVVILDRSSKLSKMSQFDAFIQIESNKLVVARVDADDDIDFV